MVFGLSLSGVGARAGRRFVRESVPHRAIVSDCVPADWGARNWTSYMCVCVGENPSHGDFTNRNPEPGIGVMVVPNGGGELSHIENHSGWRNEQALRIKANAEALFKH